MNQLKQNAFWVGIAVAGAALVAIYIFLVLPLGGEQTKLRRSVTTLSRELKDIPRVSPQDIGAWERQGEGLRSDYRAITDFYLSGDSVLEKWLPNLPAEPGRDAFGAQYTAHIQELEKALKAEGVEIGVPPPADEEPPPGAPKKNRLGFNWEIPKPEEWGKIGTDEKRVIKELQKRYWARKRMADVVLVSKVRVKRVHDFVFFDRLHAKLSGAEWEQPPQADEGVAYVNGPKARFGTFQEFELPDGMGRTITFGFAVELPYSEVPKFVREFLNPGADAGAKERLLVSLNGCRVTIREQNSPEVVVEYKYRDEEDKRKKTEDAKAKTAARPVLLALTCQIFDFDSGKFRKFAEGAPVGAQGNGN